MIPVTVIPIQKHPGPGLELSVRGVEGQAPHELNHHEPGGLGGGAPLHEKVSEFV